MSNNDNKIDDKNRNVPALRFEGFTDPWVQCKLSEIVKPIRRKNKNNEANIPLTISDIYGIIDQRGYFNRQVASKDLSNYTLLLNGDFAYNKSYSTNNHYGTVARLDNYESGALSTLYITFRPQFISSDFLMFYYKSSKWHEEIYKIAAEGARNHGLLNIFTDDFFSTKLIVPREELEQDKISKLLSSLDSIITLEQEKLEHLTDISNYLSSKLFPKKSKLSPILRKIQKSEAWEKYKLGESGRSFGGLTGKTKDDFGHGEAKYITYKNIFDNIFVNSNQLDATPIDHKQNKILFGDTIFTLSSETPEEVGMSSVCLLEIEELYLNSFCFGYRFNPDKKVNYLYLAYYFRSAEFRDRMRILAQGISRYNISQQQVMKLDILLPDIEEQEFVGQVLNKHYKYIKLQNEKIKKLQTLRQFLMQTLFI